MQNPTYSKYNVQMYVLNVWDMQILCQKSVLKFLHIAEKKAVYFKCWHDQGFYIR
jgi:hypothetical protein